MKPDDPYKTLGVDSKATQAEIKAAYRKLAKKLHPDLNPGNKKAETRFKEIAAAYDQVGTEADRAKYDLGEVESAAAAEAARNSQGPFYSETQRGGGRYSSQFEGIDEETLSSIFSQMGRRRASEPTPSPDELYQLEIEFKDSVVGGEREIALPSGKKFLVKIPAGVESGMKLRFAGKGDAVSPGLPPGDIYVQLIVRSSPFFTRAGKDIEIEIPISFADAILAAEIKIPTVDGSVLMTVPANVKTGQRLRVKGKGVLDSASGKRGDQIVILKILMPENVDAEFKTAVQEWLKRVQQGKAQAKETA